MKKIIFMLCLVLGTTQLTQAQIDFGIKGGINYNSESFQEVQEDVLAGAKSKTGYHAGIWTRFNLPAIGLYLRPEIVYTELKNETTLNTTSTTTAIATYSFQKIDVPILLGAKVLGFVNIFAGPSFQYIIDGDLSFKDIANEIKDTKVDGFSAGFQFGGGVEFENFGIDVRWERGFSDTESELIYNNVTQNIKFDTRVNQIIVGLSLKF